MGLPSGGQAEGALSAAAPLALSCWRGRLSLNILVAKPECAQLVRRYLVSLLVAVAQTDKAGLAAWHLSEDANRKAGLHDLVHVDLELVHFDKSASREELCLCQRPVLPGRNAGGQDQVGRGPPSGMLHGQPLIHTQRDDSRSWCRVIRFLTSCVTSWGWLIEANRQ